MSEVIVYSGTDCYRCDQLKNILNSKGVEFNDINIREDEEARQLVLSKGFRELPVLHIEGNYITLDQYKASIK